MSLLQRDANTTRLHPAARRAVTNIVVDLQAADLPFRVFEACRTPQRQAYLYAQGRSRPGPKVTWVKPWSSMHQYGLAVDFVLYETGRWSWDDRGGKAALWTEMHSIAQRHGMTPLYKKGRLIEKPHVQIAGVSLSDLRAGRFPSGGDATWARHVAQMIGSHPIGAPPVPNEGQLPRDAWAAIFDFVMASADGLTCYTSEGASNMGVRLVDLARWRSGAVDVQDLQDLTRTEAAAILKTCYFAPCRCDDLPMPVAAVVFNGAVMHGVVWAAKLLQRVVNVAQDAGNSPLVLDGIIGPKTLAAVSRLPAHELAHDYLDQQLTEHPNLAGYTQFGASWRGRLAALRPLLSSLVV